MTDDGEDAGRCGVELPPGALSPEALRDLEVCKKSAELKHSQLQMLRRVLDL
jgi:hypothetical protein